MKKLVCILFAVMLFAGSVLPAWAEGLESPVIPPHTHEGGEATCTEQAICDICGEPYGELDPDNHEWGDWTDNELQGKQMLQRRVCILNEEHVDWQYVAADTPNPVLPDVSAEPLPRGTVFVHTNERTYRYLGNGEVALVSVSAKDRGKKTIRVASYITVNGQKYTITAIDAGAFNGCKKLKKLQISSSTIRYINPKAFSGLSSSQKKKITVKIKGSNPYIKKLKLRLKKAGIKKSNIKIL